MIFWAVYGKDDLRWLRLAYKSFTALPNWLSIYISICSIDDTLQVKITDNALSRDLFPMDYHCLGDNENRPVRWMALESLVNNEFSGASDVVS